MSEDNEIIDNKAVRRIRIKVRIRLTAFFLLSIRSSEFGIDGEDVSPSQPFG